VIVVSDFQEFADALCEKFQIIVGPPIGGEILPIDVTTLFVAGAAANASVLAPVLGIISGTAAALVTVKKVMRSRRSKTAGQDEEV
jgi:hypothetical protein